MMSEIPSIALDSLISDENNVFYQDCLTNKTKNNISHGYSPSAYGSFASLGWFEGLGLVHGLGKGFLIGFRASNLHQFIIKECRIRGQGLIIDIQVARFSHKKFTICLHIPTNHGSMI